MQRFYWFYSPLAHNQQLIVDHKLHPDLFHQLTHVLRIASGDEVAFFSANSREDLVFSLSTQDKKQLVFTFLRTQAAAKELPFQLILAQAIPQKSEKWEWLLQKGTELGVHSFLPIISQHTQRQHLPKVERMEKIVIEASEQCGRTYIPHILPPIVLSTWQPQGTVLLASLNAKKRLWDFVDTIKQAKSITCIVGPEGGLNEEEELSLIKIGALPYHLGSPVLRLETAALASLSIINQLG